MHDPLAPHRECSLFLFMVHTQAKNENIATTMPCTVHPYSDARRETARPPGPALGCQPAPTTLPGGIGCRDWRRAANLEGPAAAPPAPPVAPLGAAGAGARPFAPGTRGPPPALGCLGRGLKARDQAGRLARAAGTAGATGSLRLGGRYACTHPWWQRVWEVHREVSDRAGLPPTLALQEREGVVQEEEVCAPTDALRVPAATDVTEDDRAQGHAARPVHLCGLRGAGPASGCPRTTDGATAGAGARAWRRCSPHPAPSAANKPSRTPLHMASSSSPASSW